MTKWFNAKQILVGLISCMLIPVIQASPEQTPDAAPQISLLYSKAERITYFSAGRYEGIDESKKINISNISFGKAYYMTNGLGFYGELLATLARGQRDGVDANTEGLGAFFALRWHFLRANNWSVFLNHGIGPILFLEEFPPGGTKLNGLIQYGLGMTARIEKSTLLQLGVRHIHISNGKGMVEDNPSFDGRGVYFEVAKQL